MDSLNIDSIIAVYRHDNEYLHNKLNNKESYPWYVILFCIALPFLLAAIYFSIQFLKQKKWHKGVFPSDLPYNIQNLMEAEIALSACLIMKDRYRQMEKIHFIKSYFLASYNTLPFDLSNSVQRNFMYPMEVNSVVKWLNFQKIEEKKKKRIIAFLISLCRIDRLLVAEEYEVLKEICIGFGLEISFLDKLIMSENEEKKPPKQTYTSSKAKYLHILGLDDGSNLDEIKRAYKRMVKLYHPDKFSNDTIEKQAFAHQRFIEIQEAYEKLIN